MLQNETDSEDFFAGLYETRPSKIYLMILSALMSPINVMLLYSVIWFERFGTDLKRTLVNQAVSSMCWCGLFLEFLLWLNILR